ncbi:Alpha/Beta hydrolase protein [Chiua virens]|nr:Alpha/Beta hydrolase protein [Chiua virens]
MSESQTAPYGKWESTITPESVVQGSIDFTDLFVDPINDNVYHIEPRPEDNARYVIVDSLAQRDLLPPPYSARTGVQEYGGAAAIAYGGTLYFSNSADNCVYSVKATGNAIPEPVTPENPKYRYANFAVHPVRHDLLVSILEDHTIDTPQTVVTTLCVINTTRKAVFPLVVGADLYAAPVFNPSGTKLAWQEWYHPDMPWEGSLINVADVLVQADTILVLNKTRVAGELLTKSVNFPRWVSDTTLAFTSDELNGFQNPFSYSTLTASAELAIPESVKEDFSWPAWYLGNFLYAILDDPTGSHSKFGAFIAYRDGRSALYIVNLCGKKSVVQVKDFPFSTADRVIQRGSSIVFNASKSDAPGGIFSCTFSGPSFVPSYQLLKSSSPQSTTGNETYITAPQPITLYRDGKPLYVVYYSPKNPKYSGSSIHGEKPPCIVNVHGDPTSMEAQTLNWEKLYYTSRGYAWVDVNYGGSSCYGREYVTRLDGNWGVVDVQDCHDAATLLAAAPYSLIDVSRVAIRGGSAGGFTTLAAVSFAPNPGFFKAAASSFGVSDLFSFAQFTHKYELRYADKLLGGTAQTVPEVYAARSAVNHADKIVTPLLVRASSLVRIPRGLRVVVKVLQGADDKIVLPEQAEKIVNTIVGQGHADKVKYRLFEGEGHGWRRAETIKEAVELEHDWYDKHLV